MPRKAREMPALEVGRLKADGMHAVGGVPGLYLQVVQPARTWILRATIGHRRRDMGLGPFPEVGLALAREKARQARQQIDQGLDPIEVRKQAKGSLKASVEATRTFAECTAGFLDAKSSEWRNAKHRQQWQNTVTQYADPVIGEVLVRDVQLGHVLRILEPIWKTKTETASRLRGRLESVLDWATVRGYRTGSNPARWRGHLDKLLPAPAKIAKVEHHQALPIDSVPLFMRALRAKSGVGARALEFLILTGVRSGEARGATWDEIDMERAEWLIPAKRMKVAKEHRVPLSPAVLRLLQSLPRLDGTPYVFPSRKGGPLSDMTLTKCMRDMSVDAVPHGFRSTFRDWASERTSFPREVCEMALAHAIGDKVEAAYRRGELLEKRRGLMTEWSEFCHSGINSA
jgi:integrase